ncbi:uncharacterized protein VTP21DRAFT_5621 [Calcarisporiella thermophila]|uniref:uncharacterized protein n=1 Tax=Calcarisporiella thermophila TaxID=911321 RepID=UPI0037442C97
MGKRDSLVLTIKPVAQLKNLDFGFPFAFNIASKMPGVDQKSTTSQLDDPRNAVVEEEEEEEKRKVVKVDELPPDLQRVHKSFSNRTTKEYRGHKSKVHTVHWNCEGRKLASGSVDKTVRIWTPDRGTDVRYSYELKGHTDSVDQLRWDPTHPDRLATASCDGTVRIWDQRQAKCNHIIQTNGENINICWSADGTKIAVGNKEDVINFIDAQTFKIEKTLKNNVEINEITWNKKGDLFFMTTGQGTVKVLEYPSLKLLHTIRAHGINCYCLELDPTGRYLATGSADSLVSLWDMKEFTCLRTIDQLDWPVRTISFSHDGRFLASASEDLVIDISDVETGLSVFKIPCTAAINTVSWHPSRYYLAYAGDDASSDGTHLGNLRIFGMHS